MTTNYQNMTNDLDLAELTKLDAPLMSVTPRYQRKQSAAEFSTPSKRNMSSPRRTPSKRQNAGNDRFIPNRANFDADVAHFHMSDENSQPDMPGASPKAEEYKRKLANTLGVSEASEAKILHFKDAAPAPKQGHQNNLKVLYSSNKSGTTKPSGRKFFRHIPAAPEKILDAPDFKNDYYLNLLSWGSNNVLAIALDTTVYLWNATTGEIECLLETNEPGNPVTSLSWVQQGNYLGVGLNDSTVQLWDTEGNKMVRTMKGHMGRISALDWNEHILSSGSADTNIINHDVRIRQHNVMTHTAHTQEICGLKWSPDGTQLASGGNDNLVHIWSLEQSAPHHVMSQHTAAVKALAWCPWQKNLLATGGGSACRHIKFWNTGTGMCVNSIDTYSQVCALTWSKHEKEIVSGHGYSQNQISIWKYPTMVKVADLTGHTGRVLAMDQSPDGTTVVSASADETLRFWKCLGANDTRHATTGAAAAAKGAANKAGAENFLNSVNLR